MISEENLVELFDINPFSITKLYQHHDLPVIFKTDSVVWQAKAFYKFTDFAFEVKVINVGKFCKEVKLHKYCGFHYDRHLLNLVIKTLSWFQLGKPS